MTLSATTVVACLTFGALVPGASSAFADASPAAGTASTVTADVLPAPQIGDGLSSGQGDLKGTGVVWDQVVLGDTVYVGGAFNYARPAGAAPGERVVERKNFLAYNLKTGDLLDLAIPFNQQIQSLAASPDGKRLYVGGNFTTAGGQERTRIAAIDLASGTIVPEFKPYLDTYVKTIAVTESRVYVGGAFKNATQAKGYSSAVSLRLDGTLDTAWQPNVAADARATFNAEAKPSTEVRALLVSPDRSKVIIGGSFNSLNGSNPVDAKQTGNGMGAVRADTGDSLPWAVNSVVRGGTSMNGITSLATDGQYVYGSGFWAGFGHGAVGVEGTFKASWDGTMQWMEDCHGDTYSVFPHGDAVYKASHAHTCETSGAFKDTDYDQDARNHSALALSKERKGTLTATPVARYGNFAGQPATEVLNWFPKFTAGTYTGQTQAAWDVTAAGDYVLMGGEFTAVNGVKQAGLVRFGTKAVAPNKNKPVLEGAAMTPTVTGVQGTYVRLSWAANYDRDNEALTYQVIRDEDMAHPVFTKTVESRFYKRPTIRATDGYLKPGSTHTYRIRTVDPDGNARWGDPVSYTVPASGAADGQRTSYDSTVLADQPTAYWPFNEQSGATAFDWAGGKELAMVNYKTDGAEASASPLARSYNLKASTWAMTNATMPTTKEFSTEFWFRTTSKTGGHLVGMSTKRDKTSPFDRQLYMDTAGRVTFAATDGTVKVLTTTTAFNDGKWHHVAATVGATGAVLYLDGQANRWRRDLTTGNMLGGQAFVGVGAHSMAGPSAPAQLHYTGDLDNIALYDRPITAAEVAAHYAAGKAVPNGAPVASFTSTVDGLTATVDASASSDADGKVASYAWDFGDGSTGSGMTASHAYAKAGTYTATLTVTDDRGATAATTRTVEIAAGPVPEPSAPLARDAFERSSASGWGAAESGGEWKAGWGSGVSVGNGAGVLSSAKGQTSSVSLSGVSSDSSDSSVSFRVDNAPSGGGQFVSVVGRQVGSESYTARVWVPASGPLQLQLQRTGNTLAAVNLPDVSYKPGDVVHVRFQVSGAGTSTLAAKVWTDGAEPAEWSKSVQDSTAGLQAPGTVGLGLYVSATATAPSSVSFDDYTVTKIAQ